MPMITYPFIPLYTVKDPVTTLRKKIYDNIDPYGYNEFGDRITSILIGGNSEYKTSVGKVRDDIFAEYLQIPQKDRHNYPETWKVKDSKYRPTINDDSGVKKYKTFNIPDKNKISIIHDALNDLDHNQSKTAETVAPLGVHTVSRGMDPQKGEYVSFYDKWDIEPWSGASASGKFPWLRKITKWLGAEDASLGLGKPLHFYDRIYLNDVFNVTPEIEEGEYYGGYIRPSYIEGSKYSPGFTGDDYLEAGETLPTYKTGGIIKGQNSVKLPDFSGIKTTDNRKYDPKLNSYINEKLDTMDIERRASVLGQIIEESGGNPFAKSKNGTYQGLLQWGADRYRIPKNATDTLKTIDSQLQYFIDSSKKTDDRVSWTHGGSGSGYNSLKEPFDIFWNSDSSLEDTHRAFSWSYVRPEGKAASEANRLKVAKQVYDRLLKAKNNE